jgi:four helix bundle protein
MKNYKDLEVWQKAFQLSIEIYRLTKKFPQEEKFGLTSQLRRCAVSIPSNIAEGKGRNTDRELRHFLYIAKGSANELETQLLIAEKIGYISSEELKPVLEKGDSVLKMLAKFIKAINDRP